MTLTLEKMRADIARLIDLDPAEVGDGDHLPDLGLDSLRLMQLVTAWEQDGVKLDFAVFAESATLGEWWAAVSRSGAAG
ncbi:phosphopantetheine-binding protein [Pseudogemmobacter humi]|uniref:Isochorismatase n=1 Tax=Pseudogemmobacter humi TaxID=2483812 RepID=A0A3P5X9Z6_9RHOB|nr:phosphopantetheine-binding protein [Pseudogemmobacter humi]VDC31313.1 Isochorismatase [Pseudogemmobacter humi]